jgi:monoamine oxidase
MNVLILGGGLAGAAAALRLADRGIEATVIEAKASPGGRAMSRDGVELGGGWLRAEHGAIRALAARLGLALVPRAPLARRVWFTDKGPASSPWQEGPMSARADALFAEGPEMTFAAWLDHHRLPPELRREFMAWWAISGSGNPAAIAVEELLMGRSYGPNPPEGMLDALAFMVAGGVQGLVIGALAASGAQIVTGDPVIAVEQGATVTARLASGRVMTGDAAVLALPVASLRHVAFDPPLTGSAAIWRTHGHEGRAVKAVVEITGAGPGTLATGEARGWRWMWTDEGPSATILTAFGLADEAVLTDLPAAIATALPGAHTGAIHHHDWCADLFACGTWVAPPFAHAAAYAPVPPQGRLHFAGSDIAGSGQGWFEGAVVSGQAAADAVSSAAQSTAGQIVGGLR